MVTDSKENLNLHNHVGRKVLFMGRLPGRIYDYDPVAQMWLIKLDTTAAKTQVLAIEGQFELINEVR